MVLNQVNISSLSTELLEMVFDHYLLEHEQLRITVSSDILPNIAILHVCRLWRNIALNSSILWKSIIVDFGKKKMDEEQLPKFFHKLRKRLTLAKHQLISFELYGEFRYDNPEWRHNLLTALVDHCPSFSQMFEDPAYGHHGLLFILLKSLDASNFQRLTCLKLREPMQSELSITSRTISLPFLRVLDILTVNSDLNQVLDFFDCPQLEMFICDAELSTIDDASFLRHLCRMPSLRILISSLDSFKKTLNLSLQKPSPIFPHLGVTHISSCGEDLLRYLPTLFPRATNLHVLYFNDMLTLPLSIRVSLFSYITSLTLSYCSDDAPGKIENQLWRGLSKKFHSLRSLRISCREYIETDDNLLSHYLGRYFQNFSLNGSLCHKHIRIIVDSLLASKGTSPRFFSVLTHVEVSGLISADTFISLLKAMKLRNRFPVGHDRCRLTLVDCKTLSMANDCIDLPSVTGLSYDELIGYPPLIEALIECKFYRADSDDEEADSGDNDDDQSDAGTAGLG